jgi:hypothetical protein
MPPTRSPGTTAPLETGRITFSRWREWRTEFNAVRFRRPSPLNGGEILPNGISRFELLNRNKASPLVHLTPVTKAPEDWRSPKPGGQRGHLVA